jgi:hypothetical protein
MLERAGGLRDGPDVRRDGVAVDCGAAVAGGDVDRVHAQREGVSPTLRIFVDEANDRTVLQEPEPGGQIPEVELPELEIIHRPTPLSGVGTV